MRRFRALFTMLLALLLVIDVVTGVRVCWYGLENVSMTNGSLSVESTAFTSTDWVILLVLVGVHVALVYAVWKAWRASMK